MNNLRLRIGCKIISLGIKLMPEEWRTKKAINNLIAVNAIWNYTGKKKHFNSEKDL